VTRTVRKRRVKLTLKDDLVQQAQDMSLSGVVGSKKNRLAKTKPLEATIELWNDFNARMGSISDEYGD
jgi:hypothetical protein